MKSTLTATLILALASFAAAQVPYTPHTSTGPTNPQVNLGDDLQAIFGCRVPGTQWPLCNNR